MADHGHLRVVGERHLHAVPDIEESAQDRQARISERQDALASLIAKYPGLIENEANAEDGDVLLTDIIAAADTRMVEIQEANDPECTFHYEFELSGGTTDWIAVIESGPDGRWFVVELDIDPESVD